MKNKSVLIAGNQVLIREGIISVLSSASGIITAKVHHRAELEKRLKTGKIDVLIIDPDFDPDINPVDLARQAPHTKVLVVTDELQRPYLQMLQQAGIGCVCKTCSRTEIIEAVYTAANVYQYRTNVSQSRNIGLETFGELELLHFVNPSTATKLSVFSNLTFINARYVNSAEPAYNNKKVELAPDVIFKTGLALKLKKFTASYQLSYTSDQFADATNAVQPTADALDGLIPAYTVMDLSGTYKLSRNFSIEASVNNLADARYFTRRADSYPGPGIIPADARSYFLTLQVKL